MIRVTHVITGLELGGAELMLYRLVRALDRDRFQSRVVSLTTVGPVGSLLADIDVEVLAVGGRRGLPDPRVIPRMVSEFGRWRPSIVQTWLYHANVAGGLAARLRRIPTAWNLRQTPPEPGLTDRSTMLAVRAGSMLSGIVPDRIICCSAAVASAHRGVGYPADRLEVIPNGYDIEELHPDPPAREDVRRELGLPANAALVGLLARYHPQKGHSDFLRAAAQVDSTGRQVHFLLAGVGITQDNTELRAMVDRNGLVSRVHLLGPRLDVPRLTASLDVAVSASTFGEGFPNAVAEAMACAVPVVATSLAATRELAGNDVHTVAPGDPGLLAAAIDAVLRSPPSALRLAKTRRRIVEAYGMPSVARRYEAIYDQLAEPCAA